MVLAANPRIGSRRSAGRLPGFVAAYTEDTLWSLAAFPGFGLLLPGSSAGREALLATSFSIAIEVSRLCHAPWIDSIHRTAPGSLILRYDSVRSDRACYAVGIGLGVVIDIIGKGRTHPGGAIREA
jgi:hypothetical protein